jgi:hypothetical protein
MLKLLCFCSEQADDVAPAASQQLLSADTQTLAAGNVCGFVSRFNDAIYRSVLHVQCARPLYGRYVYVEASGIASRRTRLFSAVLCEVMVYQ